MGVARWLATAGEPARDLQALRALPGVRSVTIANQVLCGSNNNFTGVSLKPKDQGRRMSASNYQVGADGLQTMGLKLIQGRDFLPEEMLLDSTVSQQERPQVGQVIINREMAEALFPGRAAPGQVIYALGDKPTVVIGVVERLTPPSPGRAKQENHAMLLPVQPNFRGGGYLLRVDSTRKDELLKAALAALEQVQARRVVFNAKPMSEMRAAYDAQDRSMVALLLTVCAALLVITAWASSAWRVSGCSSARG